MTTPARLPRLLPDLVSHGAGAHPDRVAVIGPDGVAVTFGRFDRMVRSVAAWISVHSDPGDRIAIVGDNSVAYAVLYYGVPRAGRILTLINQRLAPAEQQAQLALTHPTVVVGDATHLDRLGAVPHARHTLTLDSPQWGPAADSDSDVTSLPDPDDPAWLLFTSGSTGTPKGVAHTHRSVLAAVQGSVIGRAVPPGGVYLLPFPMCHIAGYNMLVQHAVGATVVLANRFRADEFAATVRAHGVTSCSLAPTMLHALLAHLDETGTTLPTLRAVAYGSAAVPADLLRRALDRLDVEFHQGYGMTETGGNVTFLDPDTHRRALAGSPGLLAAAGRPHPGVAVRIASTGPRSGEVGEIEVRGAQVAARYWPDRPATSPDGWLPTGDIGRIDDDGLLYVVDRLKDIVVTGGENVSSREVEDVLVEHPGVEMAAVVGVPDHYWGEAICAVVVAAAEDRPAADELVTHVRSRLSAFKRPRHVLFVDTLPLTTNGKVAKEEVRRFARAALATQPGTSSGPRRFGAGHS
ncbi:AMP-dependent synthetase [Mycobacterium sp. PS03-16]|uniref:AMP-binding protein n=1 Tax=Mycobacterium sp. PS03-16 TaxID=2559611 RepID=UPI0010743299|nr:AMP-binding protein [Mycobacterium sp. PS03-16]TFV57347.1 AMP-dependent synthetase [Mycobacterium sp. PS03-16]